MSNPYSTGQPWEQPNLLYSQQLDQSYGVDSYPEHGQPQDQQRKQQPHYQGSYHYQHQQGPSTSSLQGALQVNQASSHSRSSSYNNGLSPPMSTSGPSYTNAGGAGYGNSPPVSNPSYRGNPTTTFTFGTTNLPPPTLSMAGPNEASAGSGAYMTDSPTLQESFAPGAVPPRPDRYYQSQANPPAPKSQSSAKRQRASNDEAKADESDSKTDAADKDKAKP